MDVVGVEPVARHDMPCLSMNGFGLLLEASCAACTPRMLKVLRPRGGHPRGGTTSSGAGIARKICVGFHLSDVLVIASTCIESGFAWRTADERQSRHGLFQGGFLVVTGGRLELRIRVLCRRRRRSGLIHVIGDNVPITLLAQIHRCRHHRNVRATDDYDGRDLTVKERFWQNHNVAHAQQR